MPEGGNGPVPRAGGTMLVMMIELVLVVTMTRKAHLDRRPIRSWLLDSVQGRHTFNFNELTMMMTLMVTES